MLCLKLASKQLGMVGGREVGGVQMKQSALSWLTWAKVGWCVQRGSLYYSFYFCKWLQFPL